MRCKKKNVVVVGVRAGKAGGKTLTAAGDRGTSPGGRGGRAGGKTLTAAGDRGTSPKGRGGEAAFEFRMDGRQPLASDEKVLAALREFGESVGGRGFRMAEFEAWKGRPCSAAAVLARFRGWRRALR